MKNFDMHSIISSFSREVSQHYDSYFREVNLATSYVELLLLVGEREPVAQKTIADRMNLAPSTITRFIQKLEKRGLVEKLRDHGMLGISLSPAGKALLPNLIEYYEQANSELIEKLGEKFVDTTGKLLEHGTRLLKE